MIFLFLSSKNRMSLYCERSRFHYFKSCLTQLDMRLLIVLDLLKKSYVTKSHRRLMKTRSSLIAREQKMRNSTNDCISNRLMKKEFNARRVTFIARASLFERSLAVNLLMFISMSKIDMTISFMSLNFLIETSKICINWSKSFRFWSSFARNIAMKSSK
jgi:hypothetical protein